MGKLIVNYINYNIEDATVPSFENPWDLYRYMHDLHTDTIRSVPDCKVEDFLKYDYSMALKYDQKRILKVDTENVVYGLRALICRGDFKLENIELQFNNVKIELNEKGRFLSNQDLSYCDWFEKWLEILLGI
jgi:hypothetical protein